MREFIEFLRDDGIDVGRWHIRCFSPLWWLVRAGQGILGVAGVYVFYILLWLVMGP